MLKRRLSAVITICALASGCARNVRVRMPSEANEPTGTITILLTQPARDLTVAINGHLVANRAHTKKLVVDNVPTGLAEVVIAAGGGPARIERHVQIYVEHDREVVVPLGSPEQSMTSGMQLGMLSVVAWVISRGIYLAFM